VTMGRVSIRLPADIRPFQMGFEGVTDRSCNGSVHFHPLATVMLTEEEWEAFRKERRDLLGRVVISRVESEQVKVAAKEPAPEAPKEPEVAGVNLKEASTMEDTPPNRPPEPPRKTLGRFRTRRKGP